MIGAERFGGYCFLCRGSVAGSVWWVYCEGVFGKFEICLGSMMSVVFGRVLKWEFAQSDKFLGIRTKNLRCFYNLELSSDRCY